MEMQKRSGDIQIKDGDISLAEKMKLYKEVFGGAPWNEGFICKSCQCIYPKQFAGSCNCGNNNMEPFYKNHVLKKELKSLCLKNGYQERIAYLFESPIGFMRGRDTSLEQLNKDKLFLNASELSILNQSIKEVFPNFDIQNFYYFAEIGVIDSMRGKGVAKKMYEQNLKYLQEKKESYILVRTTKKTDMPLKWFEKKGYKNVYDYNDEQQRVILVYKIRSGNI